MSEAKTSKVLVAGVGALGARCAETLVELGQEVVLLDQDQNLPWFHRRALEGLPWHLGDVRDEGVLLAAGLREAQALIVTTGDEVHNLTVAMLAKRLAPELRVVVSLFSDGVLKDMAAGLTNTVVLDAAALTAPNFLYGALYPQLNQVVATPAGPYLLGAWASPSRSGWAAKPGQDDGDWIGLDPEGRSQEPLALGQAFVPVDTKAAGLWGGPRQGQGWAAWKPWWRRNRLSEVFAGPLLLVASALALLILLMTLYFSLAFGLAPLWALYFVVTTLTTTGFGDITPKAHQGWAVLAVILLMLAGPVLVGAVSALLTDLLLAIRLGGWLQSRNIPKEGHVIVYGLGRVGYRIHQELSRLGLPAVGIAKEVNQALAQRARLGGMPILAHGDGHLVLEEANLAKAKALLVVTDDESHNLHFAMECEHKHPSVQTAVRVNDPEFLKQLQQAWRFERVDGVAFNAATVFALAALGPSGLSDAFALGKAYWVVGTLVAGGPALPAGLAPSHWQGLGMTLLAWAPQEGPFTPNWPPGRTLQPGDRVVVASPWKAWVALPCGPASQQEVASERPASSRDGLGG